MSSSVPPEPSNIQRIYTSAGDYSSSDIEAKKAANLRSLKTISQLANGNFGQISQALSGKFDIQIQQEGTGFKLLYGPSHPGNLVGNTIATITNNTANTDLIRELTAIWSSIYPLTVGISGEDATHEASLIDAPSAAHSVAHRALAATPGGDSPSLAGRVVDLSAVHEGKNADGLLINHFRTSGATDLDQAARERLDALFSEGQRFSQTDPPTPLFNQAALEFIYANDLYPDQYHMMTLDVYLLQDIIYSLDHGKFKEAAFSMSLLSPVDKQILSDRLGLSITLANFTHEDDEGLTRVAQSLSERFPPPQTVIVQFQQKKIRNFQTSISEERLRQASDALSGLGGRYQDETDRLRADLEASSRGNTELLGVLGEFNAQVPILASELDEARASAASERARAEALTLNVGHLEDELVPLRPLRDRILVVEEERNTLLVQKAALAGRIAEFEQQQQDLQAALGAAGHAEGSLEERLRALTGERDSIRQELVARRAEFKAATEELAAITESLEDIEGESRLAKIAALKLALIEAEGRASLARERIGALESEIESLKDAHSKALSIQAGEHGEALRALGASHADALRAKQSQHDEQLRGLEGQRAAALARAAAAEGIIASVRDILLKPDGDISAAVTALKENLARTEAEAKRSSEGLQAELRAKESECERLTQANKALRAHNLRLSQNLQGVEASLAASTKKVESLEQSQQALKRQNQSQRLQIQKLEKDLLAEKSKYEELLFKNDYLQDSLQANRSSLKELSGQFKKQGKELHAALEKVSSQERELEDIRGQLASSQKRLGVQTEVIAGLRAQHEDALEKKEVAERELAALRPQLQETKQTVADQGVILARLQAERDEAIGKVSKLTPLLEEKTVAFQASETALETIKAEHGDVLRDLATLQLSTDSAMEALRRDVEDLKATNAGLAQDHAAALAEASLKFEELSRTSQEKIQKLEARAGAAEDSLKSARAEHASALAALQAELSTLEGKNGKQAAQILGLQTKLGETADLLEDSAAMLVELEEKQTDLKAQILSTTTRLGEMGEANEAASKEVARLTALKEAFTEREVESRAALDRVEAEKDGIIEGLRQEIAKEQAAASASQEAQSAAALEAARALAALDTLRPQLAESSRALIESQQKKALLQVTLSQTQAKLQQEQLRGALLTWQNATLSTRLQKATEKAGSAESRADGLSTELSQLKEAFAAREEAIALQAASTSAQHATQITAASLEVSSARDTAEAAQATLASEKASFEQASSGFREEINLLKGALSELRLTTETDIKLAKKTATRAIITLGLNLAQKNALIQQLRKDLLGEARLNKQAEAAKASALREIEALETSLLAVEEKVSAAHRTLGSFTSVGIDKPQDIAVLKKQIEILQAANASLLVEFEAFKRSSEKSAHASAAAGEAKVSELRASHAQAIKAEQDQTALVQASLADAQRTIKGLEEKVIGLESTNHDLQEALGAKTADFEDLKLSTSARIAALEASLITKDEELTRAREVFAAELGKASSLHAAALQEAQEAFNLEKSLLNGQISVVTLEKDRALQEIEGLQKELSALRAENHVLKSTQAEQALRIGLLETQAQAANDKAAGLGAALEEARGLNVSTSERLGAAEKLLEIHASTIQAQAASLALLAGNETALKALLNAQLDALCLKSGLPIPPGLNRDELSSLEVALKAQQDALDQKLQIQSGTLNRATEEFVATKAALSSAEGENATLASRNSMLESSFQRVVDAACAARTVAAIEVTMAPSPGASSPGASSLGEGTPAAPPSDEAEAVIETLSILASTAKRQASEIEGGKETIAANEREIVALGGKLEEAARSAETLGRANQALTAAKEQAEASLLQVRTISEVAIAEKSRTIQELEANLKAQIAESRLAIEELRAQILQKTEESEGLIKERETLQELHAASIKQLQARQAEELASVKGASRSEIEALKVSHARTLAKQEATFKEQLDSRDEELRGIKASLQGARDLLETEQGKNKALLAQAEEDRAAIALLEQTGQALREALKASEQEGAITKTALDTLREDFSRYQAVTKIQLMGLRKAQAETKANSVRLVSEKSALSHEVSALQEQLEGRNRELQEAQARHDASLKEFGAAKDAQSAQALETQAVLDKAMLDNRTLLEGLAPLNERLRRLSESNASLREKEAKTLAARSSMAHTLASFIGTSHELEDVDLDKVPEIVEKATSKFAELSGRISALEAENVELKSVASSQKVALEELEEGSRLIQERAGGLVTMLTDVSAGAASAAAVDLTLKARLDESASKLQAAIGGALTTNAALRKLQEENTAMKAALSGGADLAAAKEEAILELRAAMTQRLELIRSMTQEVGDKTPYGQFARRSENMRPYFTDYFESRGLPITLEEIRSANKSVSLETLKKSLLESLGYLTLPFKDDPVARSTASGATTGVKTAASYVGFILKKGGSKKTCELNFPDSVAAPIQRALRSEFASLTSSPLEFSELSASARGLFSYAQTPPSAKASHAASGGAASRAPAPHAASAPASSSRAAPASAGGGGGSAKAAASAFAEFAEPVSMSDLEADYELGHLLMQPVTTIMATTAAGLSRGASVSYAINALVGCLMTHENIKHLINTNCGKGQVAYALLEDAKAGKSSWTATDLDKFLEQTTNAVTAKLYARHDTYPDEARKQDIIDQFVDYVARKNKVQLMEAVVKYPNLCKELATLRIRFGSSVRNQEEPRIKEFYDAIQEGFKLLKIIIPKMIDVLP